MMIAWRRTFVVALSAMWVAACSSPVAGLPPATSEVAQSDDDWPSAKVSTPLEAKKALERLDLFSSCSKPRRGTSQSASDADASVEWGVVECELPYVPAPSGIPGSIHPDGRVALYITNSDDWPGREALCSVLRSNQSIVWDEERWGWEADAIVTDDRTFFLVAQSLSGRTASSEWPETLWPEDFAGKLGGAVVLENEYCS